LRKISPTRGVLSPIKNVCAAESLERSRSSSGAQIRLTHSVTGKPFSAMRIAGSSTSGIFFRPKRSSSFCQPSTAPGTVTESMPCSGISRSPFAFRCSIVNPAGAQPLAFSP